MTSSTPNTCTVSSGVVTFAALGTCTLVAHAASTANYNAATGNAESFAVYSNAEKGAKCPCLYWTTSNNSIARANIDGTGVQGELHRQGLYDRWDVWPGWNHGGQELRLLGLLCGSGCVDRSGESGRDGRAAELNLIQHRSWGQRRDNQHELRLLVDEQWRDRSGAAGGRPAVPKFLDMGNDICDRPGSVAVTPTDIYWAKWDCFPNNGIGKIGIGVGGSAGPATFITKSRCTPDRPRPRSLRSTGPGQLPQEHDERKHQADAPRGRRRGDRRDPRFRPDQSLWFCRRQLEHQLVDGTGSIGRSDLNGNNRNDIFIKTTYIPGGVALGECPEPPNAVFGLRVSAVEGVPFSGVVATLVDPDTSATASEYTATIDWGDGSALDTGAVAGIGGSFTVTGGHAYTEEGGYTITTTVTDVDARSNTATASSTATVADAALHPGVFTVTPSVVIGNPTSASFSFADDSAFAPASDFAATIDWGDGFVSQPVVVGSNGELRHPSRCSHVRLDRLLRGQSDRRRHRWEHDLGAGRDRRRHGRVALRTTWTPIWMRAATSAWAVRAPPSRDSGQPARTRIPSRWFVAHCRFRDCHRAVPSTAPPAGSCLTTRPAWDSTRRRGSTSG